MWHKEAVELAKGYDTVGLGMRARLDFLDFKNKFCTLERLVRSEKEREQKRWRQRGRERVAPMSIALVKCITSWQPHPPGNSCFCRGVSGEINLKISHNR